MFRVFWGLYRDFPSVEIAKCFFLRMLISINYRIGVYGIIILDITWIMEDPTEKSMNNEMEAIISDIMVGTYNPNCF